MNDREAQYVEDILDAADKIAEIVAQGRESFDGEWVQRYASERALDRLGQAAKRLSDWYGERYPGLPFQDAKDQRNFITHRYDEIDYEIVWHTLAFDVPELAAGLRSILAERPS